MIKLQARTEHGDIEWKWKDSGHPSAEYKSINHQWWIPKKSDLQIVSKLDVLFIQDVKDEIWNDMQPDLDYLKGIYKLHKQNRKNVRKSLNI